MKSRDEINSYHRAWEAAHKGRRRGTYRQWAQKMRDENRLVPSRVKVDRHILPGALRLQEIRWRKKLEVIELLGGKCVNCGVSDVRILQVNHMNGDGAAERKTHFSHYKFINDILSGERSTSDLELRCANCNILHEFERGARWYTLIDQQKQVKPPEG